MNTIEKSLLERIADACDGRPDFGYSGRGMYGDRCAGIVVENDLKAAMQIGAFLERELADDEDFQETYDNFFRRSMKMDSMGHDYIIYWPHISVEGYVGDEDEEEEEEWED